MLWDTSLLSEVAVQSKGGDALGSMFSGQSRTVRTYGGGLSTGLFLETEKIEFNLLAAIL
jgi:hypothetical protein